MRKGQFEKYFKNYDVEEPVDYYIIFFNIFLFENIYPVREHKRFYFVGCSKVLDVRFV